MMGLEMLTDPRIGLRISLLIGAAAASWLLAQWSASRHLECVVAISRLWRPCHHLPFDLCAECFAVLACRGQDRKGTRRRSRRSRTRSGDATDRNLSASCCRSAHAKWISLSPSQSDFSSARTHSRDTESCPSLSQKVLGTIAAGQLKPIETTPRRLLLARGLCGQCPLVVRSGAKCPFRARSDARR